MNLGRIYALYIIERLLNMPLYTICEVYILFPHVDAQPLHKGTTTELQPPTLYELIL